MTEQESAEFALQHGQEYPYAPEFRASDWAEAAALGITQSLCDRRGIKWEMEKVDDDVRADMIRDFAAIVRAAAALS